MLKDFDKTMNFGPRGPFPGANMPGANSPSGRFRNMYQQSPPPNMNQQRGGYHHKERAVTFMPNETVKIPKPPKQPDKPLPAYMRYSRKVWEKVKSMHPEMKMWDIGKLIGEQWRNLPEDERQGFFAEYEVEKAEYQEAMKSYHNSTAYREWLKAKEKAQQALQEQQIMEKMMGQQMPKEEPRFQLQQVEEDDEDAEFAAKHIATTRFQRNHRLIAEIFSETVVPDSKTIMTKPRLENLKRQVQPLMQHQKKLENEIQEMEERFEAKKRKIIQNSEEFESKMKELSKPPPPLLPTEESKDSTEGENKTEDLKAEKVENEKESEKMEVDEQASTVDKEKNPPSEKITELPSVEKSPSTPVEEDKANASLQVENKDSPFVPEEKTELPKTSDEKKKTEPKAENTAEERKKENILPDEKMNTDGVAKVNTD